MTEGRQEQKQVKALLRQLKAVEREERRHRETARAQRRHVKHRQISRTYGKTHKYALHAHWCEEEETDDEGGLSFNHRGARWRRLRGNPWLYIDGQGWKVVATYRMDPDDMSHSSIHYGAYWEWEYGYQDHRESRFLAYNVHRREVLLSEYVSGGGCPTCYFGHQQSIEAIKDTIEHPSLAPPTGKAFLASAEEFLDCAQRLVDPAMKLRRAMPDDVGYHFLATLYATYTLFYSKVMPRHTLSQSWERIDFGPIAAWTPLRWSRARYNALVRLQALWRGWHFRQRVLYSPHTELGRCYLLRAWQRDCSSQIQMGDIGR